jgi:hypothetical protein
MQNVLLSMAADPRGAELLRRLNLDGFISGERRLFDGIAGMMRALDGF